MTNTTAKAFLIVGALCIAFVGACAAKAKAPRAGATKTHPEQPSTAPGPHKTGDSTARIQALVDQIKHMERGATSEMITSGATCPEPRPKTATCADVCRVKVSICGNAGKICELAGGIPENDWAQQKCREARDACSRSTARCCGCVAKEGN